MSKKINFKCMGCDQVTILSEEAIGRIATCHSCSTRQVITDANGETKSTSIETQAKPITPKKISSVSTSKRSSHKKSSMSFIVSLLMMSLLAAGGYHYMNTQKNKVADLATAIANAHSQRATEVEESLVGTENTSVESENVLVESGKSLIESQSALVESGKSLIESENAVVESGNSFIEPQSDIVIPEIDPEDLAILEAQRLANQGSSINTPRSIGRFLQKRCISCHGPRKQKGDHRFDKLPKKIDHSGVVQVYQDILDSLNLGEMPPEDEPEIPLAELTSFIDELSQAIAKAKESFLYQGTDAPIRYLNKRELKLTYLDLLGVKMDMKEIPNASSLNRFDTISQGQRFSPMHWENSFAVAQKALKMALDNEKQVEVFRQKNEIEVSTKKKHEHILKSYPGSIVQFNERAKKAERLSEKQKWTKLAANRQEEIDMAKKNMNSPLYKSGAVLKGEPHLMDLVGLNIYKFPDFKRGEYRLTIKCGTLHESEYEQTFIRTAEFKRLINPEYQPYQDYLQEVTAPHNKPEVLTFKFDLDPKDQWLRKIYLHGDHGLWVDWVELEGPLAPEYLAKDEIQQLKNMTSWSTTKSMKLIKSFALKANRSVPIDSKKSLEIQNYLRAEASKKADPQETIIDVLAMILSSPNFLYIIPELDQPDSQELNTLSYVNKLSYFLWSSMPDEELLSLAKDRSPMDHDLIRKQTDRMIDSNKIKHMIDAFIFQWLEMSRFVDTTPNIHLRRTVYNNDWERFSFFMGQEPIETMAHILKNNLPITEFIASDHNIINDTLAHYYGMPMTKEKGYTQRDILPDQPRGGLTGQAAYLLLTSSGLRTSPVERGVYLLRNILFNPPPPAPPNVPDLGGSLHSVRIDRQRNKNLTLTRLATERHRTQAQCLSCHRNMDPLGFALEGYDSLGRWIGEHSDGMSVLPSGRPVNTVNELKSYLISQKEDFVKGFIRSLLSYAAHRPITIVEESIVDKIYKKSKASGFKTRDIIKSIVTSDAFRRT